MSLAPNPSPHSVPKPASDQSRRLAVPATAAQGYWAAFELLKPITWFPPMWAFACGVVSSGAFVMDRWPLVVGGIILAGPLVCASSQAMNDWCDRHVDALNEPDRPIPSGRLPGRTGLYIAIAWSSLSLLLGWILGPLVFAATIVGLILAWAYSAPPLRLKLNGWWGNAACGFSYEGLAWFTGAAVMLGAMPDWPILALVVLYSIGAHGIMTLNDFKSVLGDKRMGVRTLPVQLGADRAAQVASVVMAVPQVVVVGLLIAWGLPWCALGVAAVLGLQIWLMVRFLLDDISLLLNPRKNAALYNGTGTVFFVLGMMISAVGVSHITSTTSATSTASANLTAPNVSTKSWATAPRAATLNLAARRSQPLDQTHAVLKARSRPELPAVFYKRLNANRQGNRQGGKGPETSRIESGSFWNFQQEG